MPETIKQLIPDEFIKFVLVMLFSLLIGLEQRRHYIKEEFESRYGTDRTFTLIGILGYILYVISPQTLIPFLGGGLSITILLAIYYFQKIIEEKKFGITSLVIALITYCLAPLVYTQPNWLVLLIVVSVLVITELKTNLYQFSKKVDEDEFITLAKFFIIAGVILPLLPDKFISAEINISPYRFWLAIVVVSSISYFSYLLKKFVFPQSGIILTGILGGLYSSTATTVILAKKSKELSGDSRVTSAILLATTMMYIRIFLLALFFNSSLALLMAPTFAVLVAITSLIAFYFYKFHNTGYVQDSQKQSFSSPNNPLEFKTSLLFGTLFIFFVFITGYVNKNYGAGGIHLLSFVVGVTDIDPFILNLFQSKWNISDTFLIMAVVNATTSNNLLKMIYSITLCDKSLRKSLIAGFSVLIATGLIISFIFL